MHFSCLLESLIKATTIQCSVATKRRNGFLYSSLNRKAFYCIGIFPAKRRSNRKTCLSLILSKRHEPLILKAKATKNIQTPFTRTFFAKFFKKNVDEKISLNIPMYLILAGNFKLLFLRKRFQGFAISIRLEFLQ